MVRPDQVSLGVLVTAVTRDVIDVAVAACGVAPNRAGGKLPAHVTVREPRGTPGLSQGGVGFSRKRLDRHGKPRYTA